MKKIRLGVFLLGLLGAAQVTHAYELATHGALTWQAYQMSALVTGTTRLQDLGIDSASANPFGTVYYDVSGAQVRERLVDDFEGTIISERLRSLRATPLSIPGWLMRGAIREDDLGYAFGLRIGDDPHDDPYGPFWRVMNHFYDPARDSPLTLNLAQTFLFQTATGENTNFHRAPDWAIGSTNAFTQLNTSEANRRNHFTVFDARDAMYRALSGRDSQGNPLQPAPGGILVKPEGIRKAYWATTFRALGDLLHLNQDMGQPQHTRNDPHSGVPGFGHESVFEKYIDARATGAPFTTAGAGTPGVTISVTPDPLKYQVYNPFMGVYQDYPVPPFTNYRSFFTTRQADGRDNLLTRVGLADYSNRSFFSAGKNFDTIEYTYPTALVSGTVDVLENWEGGPLPPDTAATYLMGDLPDSMTGGTDYGVLLSTYGMWDQFLAQKTGQFAYTLTRRNYDAMADLLIPRAVAYSAGLINYFFRGKIDLVPDPANTGQFLLQNLGTEPINGTFELYYDAVDSTRYPVPDANGQPLKFPTNGALAPGQNLPIAAFAAPTNPAPKLPLAYLLVFRGDMGEEKAGAGTVGAVAAKLVSARAGLGLYLLGQDASGNTVTMKVDSKGLRVIRGPDATGTLIQNAQEFDPFQNGVPTQNPSGVVPKAYQLKQVAFQPTVTGDFSYTVVSVAVGDATAPVINGFVSPATALSYGFDSTQNKYVLKGSGVTWRASSALGEFTFSLAPNGTIDGVPHPTLGSDGGTLQFTRKFKDANGNDQTASGSVALPMLTTPIDHGDYNGFLFGALFVSGDGLKLSGLKPAPDGPGNFTTLIENRSLVISLAETPTLNLADEGSTQMTAGPGIIRNTNTPHNVTRVGRTFPICFDTDLEAANGLASGTEKFYTGYVNDILQTYTRTVDGKDGLSINIAQCTPSLTDVPFPPPPDRMAIVGSLNFSLLFSTGNSAQLDFSFSAGSVSLKSVDTQTSTSQCTVTILPIPYEPPSSLAPVSFGPPRDCTKTGTVNTIRIETLERVITSDANNIIVKVRTTNDNSPPQIQFRGTDLGVAEYVVDSSPRGEVFFATSDLNTLVHEPKPGGGMPTITRGDLPANIVKLLAAIWL